jgi:hypothetical protein
LAACGGGRTTGECDTVSDCPKDYPYECIDGQCVPGGGGGGGGDSDGGGGGDAVNPPTDTATIVGDSLVAPDTVAPDIVISSPGEYFIVGRWILVDVSITDEGSGVDPASVSVTLVGNPTPAELFPVDLQDDGAGHYVGVVDSLELGQLLHPAIVARAADVAGNESEQGHSFTLDNQPPLVAFSSPDVQLWKGEEDELECSSSFNPLGASAVKAGDIIRTSSPWGMLIYPRARIEDRGNDAGIGMAPVPIAGVDDEETFLYLLDNAGLSAGHRLLVGSGTCTGINPAVLPSPTGRQADEALVQKLVPVAPAGAGNYFDPPPGGGACTAPGTATEAPEPVCRAPMAADITYWIYATVSRVPAVYVANAYDSSSLGLCTGGPIDTRTLADGSACLAAVAADRVGNTSVSAPIAICIDKDNSGDCGSFNPSAVPCADCTAPGFVGLTLLED